MSNLNLVDTHVGLILTHTSLTLPFALWMLTGYFNAIPMELDQAALIDGCSRFGVLFRILYPVAIPGLVVAGFFAFVVSWGDYLFVSILSQSNETQTLPIGLQTFMSSLRGPMGINHRRDRPGHCADRHFLFDRPAPLGFRSHRWRGEELVFSPRIRGILLRSNSYAEDYPYWCWKPGVHPKSLQRYPAGRPVCGIAPSA